MWGRDGRMSLASSSDQSASQGTPSRSGQPVPQPAVPDVSDTADERDTDVRRGWSDAHATHDTGEDAPDDAETGAAASGAVTDLADPTGVRVQARRLIREFLRAVPRADPGVALSFLHPDGTARLATRGQFTAVIDRMRPRLRQILRLSVEERWPRQKVCDYLQHISIKTFERDQVEGLDLLIDAQYDH
ncbi:MAG: hypothetical protein ACHQ4H_09370 [Ktedonobacterales bacterium]